MILQKLKKLLKIFEIRNIKNMDLEHSKGKPLQIRAIFTIFQNRSRFRRGFRRGFRAGFHEKLNSLKSNAFLQLLLNQTQLFDTPITF